MTTTITLEPLPTLGALRLHIAADFKVAAINRTDANGTAPVRLRAGVLPQPAVVALTVDDYEAAAGMVTYTLTGQTTGGAAASATVPGTMTLDSPWLGMPIMQTFSQRIESVLTYGADIGGRSGIVEPPGRNDPIVILRRMGLRRGQMQLWAGAHANVASIRGALGRGEIMMLRQPEHAGMDMYFVADRASVDTLTAAAAGTKFAVTVSYIEVARPYGFLASAPGWDFEQLATAYPDFLSVASAYPDFASLSLNEPTL